MSKSIRDVLIAARKELVTRDIDSSALDARLLMQHALGISHEQLIANDAHVLTQKEQGAFDILLRRRLAHEPVSKILGSREFYGREFIVTKDVLDPRQDTETLIDICNALSPRRILDLGAGSGAIVLTLLCEHPEASAIAVDISEAALGVVEKNARQLGVSDRLALVHGSWFEKVEGTFDLIVSNPPYIPTQEIFTLAPDVRNFDPHLALDGGLDGLNPYRVIASHSSAYLQTNGRIVTEIGAGQLRDVESIFKSHDFKLLEARLDLGSHPRALLFAHSSTES